MIEHSGVKPDIMVIAKVCTYVALFCQRGNEYSLQGLANGFPLSGVISRKEITDKLKPGSMVGPKLIYVYNILIPCSVREELTPGTLYVAQQLSLSLMLSRRKISSLTYKRGVFIPLPPFKASGLKYGPISQVHRVV